jgi:hypothetical protein
MSTDNQELRNAVEKLASDLSIFAKGMKLIDSPEALAYFKALTSAPLEAENAKLKEEIKGMVKLKPGEFVTTDYQSRYQEGL